MPRRSSILKLQYQTYWLNASEPGQGFQQPYRAQDEAHLQWIYVQIIWTYLATALDW